MTSTLPTDPLSRTALNAARHQLDDASASLRIRHEAPGTVGAIRSGNAALVAIDAALAALYETRASLVTELRRESDETTQRVDVLLASAR